MKQRAYLISLTTAAALGGFAAGAGITDVAASDMVRTHAVKLEVPNGNATIADIWDKAQLAACTQAEADLGMDPGECTIETGTRLILTRGAATTRVAVDFRFNGTWAKGSPQ